MPGSLLECASRWALFALKINPFLTTSLACENWVLPGDPVEGLPPFGGPAARPARSEFISRPFTADENPLGERRFDKQHGR